MLARRITASLLAALVSCVALTALATSRVVLLTPPAADAAVREVIHRADAELVAEGFEVVQREASSGGSRRLSDADLRQMLEDAARRERAIAAISVFADRRGAAADLWVVDRVTNKMVVRRIDVSDVPAAERPATLAIRMVELLRASLVEAVMPFGSAVDTEIPAEVERFVSPRGPPLDGFAIELGVGILASVDGLGVAGTPIARMSWGGDHGLAGRLHWAGPAWGARGHGALGTATVRQERLTLELVYAPEVDWHGLSPLASLGAGGYHLHARGQLLPPLVGSSAEVWALCGVLGAGLGYRLTNDVMALGDFEMILTWPRAVVAMRADPVGSAGRPSLAGSLGVVARF